MCNCKNVELGSYDNYVMIDRPVHMNGKKEGSDNPIISVDACIQEEVLYLWSLGIATTGCCCGHNKLDGYIGVIDEDIPRMKELGYEVKFNHCRPGDEDGFYTKTKGTRLGNKEKKGAGMSFIAQMAKKKESDETE